MIVRRKKLDGGVVSTEFDELAAENEAAADGARVHVERLVQFLYATVAGLDAVEVTLKFKTRYGDPRNAPRLFPER